MRGLLPLLFGLSELINKDRDPPVNIKTDTGRLKEDAKKSQRIREAQPISKRNLKKSLGKKNRKNRGKRRSK